MAGFGPKLSGPVKEVKELNKNLKKLNKSTTIANGVMIGLTIVVVTLAVLQACKII